MSEKLVKMEDVVKHVESLGLNWFADRDWVWIVHSPDQDLRPKDKEPIRTSLKLVGFKFSREDHTNPDYEHEVGRWFHPCGGRVIYRKGRPRPDDSKEDKKGDEDQYKIPEALAGLF